MCKKLVCFVTFVLLLGLSGAVLATDYYVSPSGNDNNPGTSPSQAWATTDKVNNMTFSPGDSISFEGGETFSGGLVFTSGGTPTSPIALSSYGSGRATIQGDLKETVLLVDNCAGFEVTDLIFRGSGNTQQVEDMPDFHGIRFYAHAGSGVKLEYIHIDNVEVCDVTNRGIFFDGLDFSGFRDVQVTNTVVHNIGTEGMNSSTSWPVSQDSHEDFYIADCVVYDVTGIHNMSSHSGSGIVFGGLNGGVIEFCEAYNNGQLNAAGGGGPLGIWCWESRNVVFQFNESHHNKTFGGDGGGFDLDGGTSFCTMQYNYSHDNQGGNLIMQFARSRYAGDNVYRYNIVANDGTGSWEGKPMGCLTFYSDSTLSNIEVYNNTFYVGPDSRAGCVTIWVYHGSYSNVNLRNNIFIAEPGKPVFTTWTDDENFTFQGNCYWSMGGPLRFILDSDAAAPVYEGLDWWRSYGQEMLDGSPVGYEFDPKLADVSSHPILGARNLANLTGYKIASDSPAIDRGLNLPTLFGLDVGSQDFYGVTIPQGSDYDIGANEELGGGQVPIPEPPAPDSIPPTPDPMSFATAPYSTSSSSIAMVATTASDTSGVQYYFTCTSGSGHDSDWQYDSIYEDTGLTPSTAYTYTVKARDISTNLNETAESSAQSATTDSYAGSIIFSDGFESGDFATGGWQAGGSSFGVEGGAAYTGNYGVRLGKGGWMQKTVNTVGYTDIRIRYMRDTSKSAQFFMRWWDGSNTHLVEVSKGEPWGLMDIVCGPEADNNPNFSIYFREMSGHPKKEYSYVDDVEIWGAGGGGPDTTPPSPDPMSFASPPAATGDSSIEMTATTATDASGVEYYFDCVSGSGTDSGWQDSTYYQDTGLSPGTEYCYTVKARDKSPAQNETAPSGSACATTTAPDTTPPSPDPMSFASPPAATGDSSIEMTATTATDDQYGVEYYFDCLTSGGHDSSWQSSTYYQDTGLSAGTQYCYTVKARDTSPNLNETAASGSACATTTAPDTTPPEPNPMTFATTPYATGNSSIAMVATTAIDDQSGVEYYFDCLTAGGHDSGWQSGTFYEDTGLAEGTQYCYTVKARDTSANQNETAASGSACATTESDTAPPSPDPMTFATAPYATGSTSIAMVATTATDASGVEYYFTCVSGGGNDSGWQDSTSYEDTGLTCETQYCYTVKARDKSPNQNTTAPSSSACATTGTCGGGPQIFFDGFEDGDYDGWTVSGSVAVRDDGAYEGTYHLWMKFPSSAERPVSTSGYTGIHLKYAGLTNGFDSGEYIGAEWYDGSDWHLADQLISNGVWTYRDITLPAGAANNPNFKIRISTNSDKNTEWARVDAVEVTGQ